MLTSYLSQRLIPHTLTFPVHKRTRHVTRFTRTLAFWRTRPCRESTLPLANTTTPCSTRQCSRQGCGQPAQHRESPPPAHTHTHTRAHARAFIVQAHIILTCTSPECGVAAHFSHTSFSSLALFTYSLLNHHSLHSLLSSLALFTRTLLNHHSLHSLLSSLALFTRTSLTSLTLTAGTRSSLSYPLYSLSLLTRCSLHSHHSLHSRSSQALVLPHGRRCCH
jgi:hypothetical protein